MLGSRRREEQMPAVLDGIQRSSFLWAGATDATMPRGEGWLFIRLGQFVERTDRLSRLFDLRWREIQARRGGRPVTTGENVEWIGLLKCCSSFEAYRLRYPTRMDERNIVDFLLLDRSFPRTLRYAVAVAAEFARRLDDTNGRGGDVARAFGRLWAEVEYTDVDEVLEQGADRFLSRVKDRLGSASLELQRTYFLH
jgi:uncharacterized alpha-E superfamily protein